MYSFTLEFTFTMDLAGTYTKQLLLHTVITSCISCESNSMDDRGIACPCYTVEATEIKLEHGVTIIPRSNVVNVPQPVRNIVHTKINNNTFLLKEMNILIKCILTVLKD